jgi:hypothetical protein
MSSVNEEGRTTSMTDRNQLQWWNKTTWALLGVLIVGLGLTLAFMAGRKDATHNAEQERGSAYERVPGAAAK